MAAGGEGGEDPYGVLRAPPSGGGGGGGAKRPATAAAAAAAAAGGEGGGDSAEKKRPPPAEGPTRPFYRHDDSLVSRVPAAEVFGAPAQSSAYILMYQLVE
jgi:hypothetical protein